MAKLGNFNASGNEINFSDIFHAITEPINGTTGDELNQEYWYRLAMIESQLNGLCNIKSLDELNIAPGSLSLKAIFCALPENGISAFYVNISDNSWKDVFPSSNGLFIAFSQGALKGTISYFMFIDGSYNIYGVMYYNSVNANYWRILNCMTLSNMVTVMNCTVSYQMTYVMDKRVDILLRGFKLSADLAAKGSIQIAKLNPNIMPIFNTRNGYTDFYSGTRYDYIIQATPDNKLFIINPNEIAIPSTVTFETVTVNYSLNNGYAPCHYKVPTL